MSAEGERKSVMSKEVKDLAPPKDDPITLEELAKCDGTVVSAYFCVLHTLLYALERSTDLDSMAGTDENRPTYLAIKGIVFDVSRNAMYKPGGSYHRMSIAFTCGCSRALLANQSPI